jgi:hypothetical protein
MKRWSAGKAATVTMLLVFVVGLMIGAVLAAVGVYADPEAAGERFGRALFPALIVAGVVAYFVQRSKIREDAARDQQRK